MTAISQISPVGPRCQLSRLPGARLPDNAILCDRRSPFGNPFRVVQSSGVAGPKMWWLEVDLPPGQGGAKLRYFPDDASAKRRAFELHRDWIALPRQRMLRNKVRVEFPGCRPACGCSPDDSCHVDTLVQIALTPMENEHADRT